ncbi:MAG: hypothetical protein K2N05_09155 [Muribaculaceae bacterium]|nr:hypothetical protein [Muribaculaceae bacterium]
MNIFTKNINGSSSISPKPKAGNGSCWREFWEKRTGHIINPFALYICPGCGDNVYGKDVFGCHVKKIGCQDDSWYIVPMCQKCNNKHDQVFYIDENLLTPVND